MQLDRRQRQLFGDISIFQFQSLVHSFPFDPFRSKRARGDSGATAKRLEFSIYDLSCIIYFNLQFHNIATSWRSHEARTDVFVFLIKRPYITWIFIVIDNLQN